jgi:hypothetical protein
MRALALLSLSAFVIGPGCGADNSGAPAASTTSAAQAASKRGGTITVADETWTLVSSISCVVYPGPVVNIAGHAAEDPSLEIVIDWGGPNQARIAESDSGPGWHAIRETLEVEVDGKKVRGRATFSEYFSGTGKRADGSFDIQC